MLSPGRNRVVLTVGIVAGLGCFEPAQSQTGAASVGSRTRPGVGEGAAEAAASNGEGAAEAAASKPVAPGPKPGPAAATREGRSTASDLAAAILKQPPESSTSIGAADNGVVRGAVQLPKVGPGFRHNSRRPDAARYGTVELVQALVNAAAALPAGPDLMINDLGLNDGGPIAQHGSHQAGRDVDILFFYRDRDGHPHPPIGVPVEPDGTGTDYKDLSDPGDDVPLRFDAGRTWHFMQALIEVAFDDVQRIFVVEHVRDALLAEARRVGAPKHILDRFALVTCQPGTPHDDHMHVRFYCSAQDMGAGCLDKPPTYPWRLAALERLGLSPALSRGRPNAKQRKARAARTTTAEQARVKAVRRFGKMHREVVAFLERRKTWQKRKRPSRPFCR